MRTSGAVTSTYYYLRDAQGNEMCRYVKYTNTSSQLMYVAQEHSIYGSSRVGVDNRKDTLYLGAAYTPTWGGVGTSRRNLGSKSFELANHLGNVLITVSDKPIYKVSGGTVYFNPEVSSISDYYPFGAPMNGRGYATETYRFGFNGKEGDGEVNGEGNSYDFGARVYSARLGRWLSVDPKAGKYPSESPFAFVGNSPIIAIDPNGEEKIVVSGGADLHNTNRMNFIMASKNQIKAYKNDLAKTGSKESVSWLILDKDYTEKEKASFSLWAKQNGIEQPIYISSADEITNYMNSKSTTNSNLSTERTGDAITNLSIMSHGVPSVIALGYENTGWTGKRADPTVLDNSDIGKVKEAAFACDAQIDLYSCNSGTPVNMEAKDYTTQDELVNDALTGNNLVSSFSNQVPHAVVNGFIGQTSYSGVGNGSLPTPATMDGSYSPTVGGQSPPTIKVQMQNGKVK